MGTLRELCVWELWALHSGETRERTAGASVAACAGGGACCAGREKVERRLERAGDVHGTKVTAMDIKTLLSVLQESFC